MLFCTLNEIHSTTAIFKNQVLGGSRGLQTMARRAWDLLQRKQDLRGLGQRVGSPPANLPGARW